MMNSLNYWEIVPETAVQTGFYASYIVGSIMILPYFNQGVANACV